MICMQAQWCVWKSPEQTSGINPTGGFSVFRLSRRLDLDVLTSALNLFQLSLWLVLIELLLGVNSSGSPANRQTCTTCSRRVESLSTRTIPFLLEETSARVGAPCLCCQFTSSTLHLHVHHSLLIVNSTAVYPLSVYLLTLFVLSSTSCTLIFALYPLSVSVCPLSQSHLVFVCSFQVDSTVLFRWEF